jgi:hypothetical protein
MQQKHEWHTLVRMDESERLLGLSIIGDKMVLSPSTANAGIAAQYYPMDLKELYSWKRSCKLTTVIHENIESTHCRKITDEVWLAAMFKNKDMPYHKCKQDEPWLREMTLREWEERPMYWCEGCGYIMPDGVSMAVRLNGLEI